MRFSTGFVSPIPCHGTADLKLEIRVSFSKGLETPSPLPTTSEYLVTTSPSRPHYGSPQSEHSDLGLQQNPGAVSDRQALPQEPLPNPGF